MTTNIKLFIHKIRVFFIRKFKGINLNVIMLNGQIYQTLGNHYKKL
jgi:hypothetical protein